MTAKLESSGDYENDDEAVRHGPTPIRSVRVTDEDWALFTEEASNRGFSSTSEFIRATMLEKIRARQ